MNNHIYSNREMSWLSFNHRVLQEAANQHVPLYERLKFLAIFSSNLDEFFRVRVASVRSVKELKKSERRKAGIKPKKLLKQIREEVHQQQEEFGQIYREQLIPALAKHQIFIQRETELSKEMAVAVRHYFKKEVAPIIKPTLSEKGAPFFKNRRIYLLVHGTSKENLETLRFVELPENLHRFQVFEQQNGSFVVMFIDDIIRLGMSELLPDETIHGCYSLSISRDAELYLEDEFSEDIVEAIKRSLSKRNTGLPIRLLYDGEMPESLLSKTLALLQLHDEDLSQGYRYHHFHDFFGFPNPNGLLPTYPENIPLQHKELTNASSLFKCIAQQDQMVHYPHHSYEHVISFLQEAAVDPKVSAISITLYRVASGSKVVSALLTALKNGKSVTAFIEVKARFDEESNIEQIELLQQAGAKVFYDLPGLKVHCKMCLVTRNEPNTTRYYAYLATGNFNEKTATIYTDIGLFTSNSIITDDVKRVFQRLKGDDVEYRFNALLVAPDLMPEALCALIDKEIDNAKNGQPAWLRFKMNSLQDTELIDKLYEASTAGVKIDLIVRGICCLIAGADGLSENIRAISIVGRYLEHSRVYMFCNHNDPLIYVGSADLMNRNLRHRVEVLFPIFNTTHKQSIMQLVELQLADNVKSRIIDAAHSNTFVLGNPSSPINSQEEFRKILVNEASIIS